MPEIAQILLLAAVGFGGGCLGGFLGIGGSIIFIPTLKYLGVDPHRAIAAALVVNVLVASGGARGHLRSGRVRKRVLAILIPVAISAAVIGVLVGNQFTDEHAIWIWRIFGIVMIYVLVHNAMRLRGELGAPADTNPGPDHKVHPLRVGAVGTAMGFSSGLLGIGGGSLAVPGLQILARLPLRNAVANSAMTMIFSCALAAVLKHSSGIVLAEEYHMVWVYIACLGPTALAGGWIGSHVTHRVKRHWVRIVFMLFLSVTAYNMLFVNG